MSVSPPSSATSIDQPATAFCLQMNALVHKPGFRDQASQTAFIACAGELLEKGVSEPNALRAMEMIHAAYTEYHGSFEATWDADYFLREQGVSQEWIDSFLGKLRTLLIWVK